jgi:hypothetical protein
MIKPSMAMKKRRDRRDFRGLRRFKGNAPAVIDDGGSAECNIRKQGKGCLQSFVTFQQ